MGRKRGGPEMPGRSGGESWRSRPARGSERQKATTEEQNRETSRIPGRRADRSRHPHSPDPGTKTAGPGEKMPRTRHTHTMSKDGWENSVERRGGKERIKRRKIL
ncbi:hypothetical protein NDU88_004380 [Pleurodeles waltl]|uniref:Uncharacterized protein n=1 Tax=Pleurodeles waltl TaxID=8319 RepID=A0AAV7MXB2_PLEWA|nr:hypothetical protein NDU88_004380 [Pleurodeles waltl]